MWRAAARAVKKVVRAAVTAQRETVVGGEDDDRVVPLAGFFQRRENPPDLLVHMRDQAVILGQLIADHHLGSRPGAQVLVATAAHHAVVEWKLRQKVHGQGRKVSIIHLTIFLRGLTRIVRRGESDVCEKRILPIVILYKLNRGVSE